MEQHEKIVEQEGSRQLLFIVVTVIIMQRPKATVHRDRRERKEEGGREGTECKRSNWRYRWWKRWHAKEAFVGKRSEPVVRRHLTASGLSFSIPTVSPSVSLISKSCGRRPEDRTSSLLSSFSPSFLAYGLAEISTSLPFRFSVENLRCTARTPPYLYTRRRSLWT